MKARLPQGFSNGGPSNMNQMIKQAQKMQSEVTRIQEEIDAREFTATVGGDAVSVVMTGNRELKNISIKPEVVDPEDIEMLQDLIVAAVNEVLNDIETTSNNEMSKVTGSMNVPGLF